ncbi:MAG: hypothetical protein Q8R17_02885, partial [bacterium]|nr:hypothetical protein [bacterium]
MLKILKWGGGGGLVTFVALAVIAGGLWYWKAQNEPFVARDFDEVVKELKDPKKIQEYSDNLVEAYKKDFDGGDTPEETLNLFIAALKAGDTDLASKYFLLEKQAEMASELKIGKEKGNLPKLIAILEKKKIGSSLYEGAYQF